MSDWPKNNPDSQWSAFRFAWQLGYTIAIPIVTLAVGGAFVDRWLGTKPWFMVGGIGLSMMLSTVGVYFKAMKVMTRMDGESKPKTDPPKPKPEQTS
jgi:F0F1-type ATP synthase assembly protein I